MTTVIILVVTHLAAFVVGALVFRNNKDQAETLIDEGQNLEKKVQDTVTSVKSKL